MEIYEVRGSIKELHLDRTEITMNVRQISLSPVVSLASKLLSPVQCQDLMRFAEPLLDVSKVATGSGASAVDLEVRKSSSATIDYPTPNEAINALIEYILKELGFSYSVKLPIHINCYRSGGLFKAHYDALATNNSYISGVDRSRTAIVYLNDSYDGGETAFLKPSIAIKGYTGDAIVFNNYNDDCTIDLDSLHAGLPLKSGVKWVAVFWDPVDISCKKLGGS